jgi:sugar O-acyltransferase (sialic acid O-acetyltransferase NeuD family)
MSATHRKIVFFGCGGHSHSVADVLLALEPGTELVFVDPRARAGERLFGFDVLREYQLREEPAFLSIGDNAARKSKFDEIGERNIISIISPTAHQGHGSRIEIGCFIANFCHIGPEAAIGKNTIINTASVIEHEVTVGAHCHVGPNATISGRSQIGDLVFVGVGATIVDRIRICSQVTIGAGATVISDIVEPGTYVGTPASRLF